jgi:SAM-dependent methyltransferase
MCGRHYPIEDGVIRFIDRDAFYENRYLPGMLKFSPNEHTPWGRILLYLVSMHYFWYIRRYIPSGSKILDLACGSGMRYLTTRGAVAGLEVSLSSAREAAKIYDLGLQASAMQIPLDAQSVDAVVSRFFFEHVPVSDKRPLLAEIRRVLQPGGWLITLQDCECNNALWKWAKKDPELFQQWFIENDGHFGLMLVSENLALLRESGFDVIKYYASNKTPLVSLPMLEWMQPYRSKSMMANIGLAAASYISRSKVLNTAYTLSTTLIDDIVERFLPVDKARYLLCASRVPL